VERLKERLAAAWEAVRDALAPRPKPQLVPLPIRVKDQRPR
jgi:hypothetical protein